MAAQPRESKSQARMKWLRKVLVVPDITETELRARVGKMKFAPTCRQINNLIHAYPGTTREPRLLFELLAPKADKADVRANHMLVVKMLTKKYGQTCGEAHWVFRDADPEETIEAYALRHFGIDASPPATPVAPTPEREVPPSLKPSVQSEPASLALPEPPASDPKVEAPSAFDVPPPAPTPTVSAVAPSAEALPTSVDENAKLLARVAVLEAELEATKMCKTAEPASLAPAVRKIEMSRVVSATPSPKAVEVPAAEPAPPAATSDADAHKEAIGADTTSLTPREDTEPCAQPRGAALGDMSAAVDAVDEQAADAVDDQTEGLAMTDNQPSTGVVPALENGVEESKEDPLQCDNCYEEIDAFAAKSLLCCPEVAFCDDCTKEFVENSSCGKCFREGISTVDIIGYGLNLEPFALIQRAMRGTLGRKLAKRVEREAVAAIHLERVWRGARARRGGVEQQRVRVAPATPISEASPSAKLPSPPKFTPNEPVEKTCRVVALGPRDSERPETPTHASPKKEDSPDEPRKLDLEAETRKEHLREVREGNVLVDLKKTGETSMKLVETEDQPVESPVTALQSGTLAGDAAKAAFEARFSEDGRSPIAELFSSPEPVTSPQAPRRFDGDRTEIDIRKRYLSIRLPRQLDIVFNIFDYEHFSS
jgi:hypothetical protein